MTSDGDRLEVHTTTITCMMSCLTSALLTRCVEQILKRTIIYTRKTVNENEIRCADVNRS